MAENDLHGFLGTTESLSLRYLYTMSISLMKGAWAR